MKDLILLERGAFLLGLLLMVAAVLCWRHGTSLKRLCTEQTPGVVVDEGRSRRLGQKNEIYLPKYSYSVLGVEYTKQTGSYNVLKVSKGQSVTVFYDPSDPQRAYVLELGAGNVGMVWALSIAGVVCILLGLLARFVLMPVAA